MESRVIFRSAELVPGSNMASPLHDQVKSYYSSLESTAALQTSAACSALSRPLSPGIQQALTLIHPEVSKRFFGCGLVAPEKLKGCSVLDLGSGSGRDCYVLSKLVGEDGHVTGIDMTEDLIQASRKYVKYHQERFGFAEPNTEFVHGYMEKLSDAGIRDDSLDVVVSNCVICLCPDKRAVLSEAYRVLKFGGELYFSDIYANEVVPESFKLDPVLWGEGMGGALYWHDFISIMKELGFSTPRLVAASRIDVHNPELQTKADGSTKLHSQSRGHRSQCVKRHRYHVCNSEHIRTPSPSSPHKEVYFRLILLARFGPADFALFPQMKMQFKGKIKYASGTYRAFKLPQHSIRNSALVTYKGTVPDCAEGFDLDASNSFKVNVCVEVDAETAAILQYTRYSPDFLLQMTEKPDPKLSSVQQYCNLSPFLLADRLGSYVKQCSKINTGSSE
ncbi:hypothetical protein C0J50_14375 [Silurus asotus]|uniref:Arsenite methyltransferase n=1 Tax=Silurus asotus TaxID=30991 RepID=A0AAD5AZY6_SILAS|nr:hypothetical protein C0J50_14375 [Silurus asotus]